LSIDITNVLIVDEVTTTSAPGFCGDDPRSVFFWPAPGLAWRMVSCARRAPTCVICSYVLIRPWTRHEVAAGRSTKIHVIREYKGTTFDGLFGVVAAMDSSQRCRDQAAECLRLVKLAQSKQEAEVLRNISSSWTRLAGQIDRYNALVREQGRIIRK
jgi:hypothetical protein